MLVEGTLREVIKRHEGSVRQRQMKDLRVCRVARAANHHEGYGYDGITQP